MPNNDALVLIAIAITVILMIAYWKTVLLVLAALIGTFVCFGIYNIYEILQR